MIKSISIKEFKELLKKGIVTFQYYKKDGSIRTAKGTLKSSLISYKSAGSSRIPPFGYVIYWDVEKDGFRKFIEDNFIGADLDVKTSVSKIDDTKEFESEVESVYHDLNDILYITLPSWSSRYGIDIDGTHLDEFLYQLKKYISF